VSARDFFKLWIRQSFIVVTYDLIVADIAKLAAKYKITSIAYDRWRIAEFKELMADVDCTETGLHRGNLLIILT
jgi:phage terminase large subunit-like protein